MFVKHSLTVIFSTNIMELDFLEKNYWYLTCRVFQIRDRSWVNDPTKNASWPDRWHISVEFNVTKKISTWSWWLLRWSPGPLLERINWNAACGLLITCHNITRNTHKAYGGATALIRVWWNIVWPPHAKCDKHDVEPKCWVIYLR